MLTVGVAGVFGLTVGLAAGFLGGDGAGAVVAAVVIALGMARPAAWSSTPWTGCCTVSAATLMPR